MKINGSKINGQSMRCLVCAVCMCLAFFLFSGYAYAEEDYAVTQMQMQGTITSESSLNVRSGPGTDYKVITKVDKDTVLSITGQADNGWYQVEVDGQTGFVSDEYVHAAEAQAGADAEPEKQEKEAGEPEEGYRGLHQSPFVMKLAAIGAVIVVVLVMLVLTLKGIRKDEEEDDGDDDDEEEDDEEDEDEDDADDIDMEDGDEEETAVRRSHKKSASERQAGGSGKKKGRKAYVLREEDYRVQIDPSFFEDREPIEQPAMVTGYLERKKIEEAEAMARAREESAGKQKELDAAMAKLSELQKEIERLKKQE